MKILVAVMVLTGLAVEPALADQTRVQFRIRTECRDSLVLVTSVPTTRARITLRRAAGSGHLTAECQNVVFSPIEIDSLGKLWHAHDYGLIRYNKLVWYLTHEAFWYLPGIRSYTL